MNRQDFKALQANLELAGLSPTGRLVPEHKPPFHELPMTPARADIAAKDKPISIDSVMSSQYEHCDIDFIFHSFYLPVQVLKSPLYVIKPIQVIEWLHAENTLTTLLNDDTKLKVFEGCCLRMLLNAKQIGISHRHILSSGQRIAVCKIWYGRI